MNSTPNQTTTRMTLITVPAIRIALDPNALPICIVAVASAVFGKTNEFLDKLVTIFEMFVMERFLPCHVCTNVMFRVMRLHNLPMSTYGYQTEPKA